MLIAGTLGVIVCDWDGQRVRYDHLLLAEGSSQKLRELKGGNALNL